MSSGLDNLKHVVVLMMENRSFDHMLGYLKQDWPNLDGLTGNETNPDINGQLQSVQPTAFAQGELDPDPDNSWEGVNLQIFGNAQGVDDGSPKMKGFIKSYFTKRQDLGHSRNIMNCFDPSNLQVLTFLAEQYAVCDRWFSSLPGPDVPNHMFANFGTSFGHVDNAMKIEDNGKSIYSRLMNAGRSAKIYFFDEQSSSIGISFMLQNQAETMGSYQDFMDDCNNGNLPDYSFVEPNYSDHGNLLASDQHPDHNVISGENFIADVYNHIRKSPLWENTLLLIVYDEHGGTYDHVYPPKITPDGITDPISGFQFDRLGIRVPAIFISPWIDSGTLIHTQYEHASIPATVADLFIKDLGQRNLTVRESRANLFTEDPDLFTLTQPRQDSFYFTMEAAPAVRGTPIDTAASVEVGSAQVSISAPPAGAYNPWRPMSVLLHDHVQELSRLELQLPTGERTNIDVSTLVTEQDASRYIGLVERRLHAAGIESRKYSKPRGPDLIQRLSSTTAGREDSRSFAQLCADSVNYLFGEVLSEPQQQSRIEDGFQIMDLVARVSPRGTLGFWGSLAQDFRCRYIVFEFKNHREPVSQNQIYTTEKYLYLNALRPAAIIIARNGADAGAKRAAQGALREFGKVLLIMDLNDLFDLLRVKDKGDDVDSLMFRHLDMLMKNLAP
jgi:phospholipase C